MEVQTNEAMSYTDSLLTVSTDLALVQQENAERVDHIIRKVIDKDIVSDETRTCMRRLEPQYKQATMNICLLGHVAHGKSTITKQLTGVVTGKHSNEKKRNCTISLGYASFKIYQCSQCNEYAYGPSSEIGKVCDVCGIPTVQVRHIALVDVPGHEALISTMINGAAIVNNAILVASANEECPSPQTTEHMMAAELLGIENYIKVQNKLDLVKSKDDALVHAAAFQKFTENSLAASAPLIPVVAHTGVNMLALVEEIVTCFPEPDPDLVADLRFSIVRTFKIASDIMNLQGGVIGGSISQGIAKKGDIIEIRPGICRDLDGNSNWICYPLFTRIQSLKCCDENLEFAVPGGLIGMQTDLDPSLCICDKLVGQIAGVPGSLPPVLSNLAVRYQILKRITDEAPYKPKKHDNIFLHVGAHRVGAKIRKVDKERSIILFQLDSPVCCDEVDQIVTVFVKRRLVGYGKTTCGKAIPIGEQPDLTELQGAPGIQPELIDVDDEEVGDEEVGDEEVGEVGDGEVGDEVGEEVGDEVGEEVGEEVRVGNVGGDEICFDGTEVASQCRFYVNEWPERDDIVTVVVERMGEHGAHVRLLEYGGLPGFIPLTQLTKKKWAKNIGNLARAGQQFICCVILVDPNTGHIDLTKSRITKEEIDEQHAKYKEMLHIHNVLARAAVISSPEPIEILGKVYEEIVWPKYEQHESPTDAILSIEEETFSSVFESPDIASIFMREIQRRIKRPVYIGETIVKIQVMSPLGVHSLRSILTGLREVCHIESHIDTTSPPCYKIQLEAQKEILSEELWKCLRYVERESTCYGCVFEVKAYPHVGSEKLEEPETMEIPFASGMLPSLPPPSLSENAAQQVRDLISSYMSTLDDGDQHNDPSVSCNMVDDIQTHNMYDYLLMNALGENPGKPPGIRLKALQILMRPKKTLIANLGIISEQMHRPLAHLVMYMTAELRTTASVRGDGCGLVLRGKFSAMRLQSLIKKYTLDFVRCGSCKSYSTELERDSKIRVYIQRCQICHVCRSLTNN